MGGAKPGLHHCLVCQCLAHRHRLRGCDCTPRCHNGLRRHSGEPRGKRLYCFCQCGIVHALPDHSHLRSRFSRHLVAQHRQAHGTRVADESRQQPRTARVGHQPDLHECLNKTGRARRNHEVATQCQVGSRACRDAVDSRNDRHRHRTQPLDQWNVVRGDQPSEVLPRCGHRIAQVLPCAKTPTGTRQDQAAHRCVRRRCFQRSQQLAMHRGGEAVHGAWTIERQRSDAVCVCRRDRGLGH